MARGQWFKELHWGLATSKLLGIIWPNEPTPPLFIEGRARSPTITRDGWRLHIDCRPSNGFHTWRKDVVDLKESRWKLRKLILKIIHIKKKANPKNDNLRMFPLSSLGSATNSKSSLMDRWIPDQSPDTRPWSPPFFIIKGGWTHTLYRLQGEGRQYPLGRSPTMIMKLKKTKGRRPHTRGPLT